MTAEETVVTEPSAEDARFDAGVAPEVDASARVEAREEAEPTAMATAEPADAAEPALEHHVAALEREPEPLAAEAQPEPLAAEPEPLAAEVQPEPLAPELHLEPEPEPAAAGPVAEAAGLEPAPAHAREPAHAPEPPRSTEPRAVGRTIGDLLASAGARFAFTVPGESFLPLIDGLSDAGIRVVATRHEGAAAFMAEAAAQLTGRPQVVLATRAVGASNAAIGIHTARQDSAPLVALFGQVRREYRGREAFQEADLAATIGGLASWAAEARDGADAVRQVAEGLRRATRGRPGPVVVALPEDVLDGTVPAAGPEPATPSAGAAADRGDVRQVLKWLDASERGVILAGGGVLRARASKRLTALAEALAVPVIVSWRRPDVIPNDHPNYLGMSGYWSASTVRKRLEEADVLLALGCRLGQITSFGYSIPTAGATWAHVDLEPRHNVSGLPNPNLAITADAARFLDACWSDLRGAVLDVETRSRREVAMAADREAYREASRVDQRDWDGPGVHPGRVVTTLQRVLPHEALLTTDAGNFGGWVARGYQFVRPGTFLGPTSGAMGYGLPAAIAAALIRPDRPAVALSGDGGFSMTMAELETAVREHARVIAIVFDNGQYGTIRMHQAREGRPETATHLGPIDFAAVARAFGVQAFTVDTDAEFEPALTAALAARTPSLIHLKVDPRWVSVDEVA